MTTANAHGSVSSTIKSYQDKIAAQMRDAKMAVPKRMSQAIPGG